MENVPDAIVRAILSSVGVQYLSMSSLVVTAIILIFLILNKLLIHSKGMFFIWCEKRFGWIISIFLLSLIFQGAYRYSLYAEENKRHQLLMELTIGEKKLLKEPLVKDQMIIYDTCGHLSAVTSLEHNGILIKKKECENCRQCYLLIERWAFLYLKENPSLL